MHRNLLVITITAVLFGLAFGVYDLVLPLWLAAQEINYVQMGWIFAVSNGVMIFVPIVTGWLADRFGRKNFFATSIGVCSLACLLTPMSAHMIAQTLMRLLHRTAAGVYEALQGVLVFESNRGRFMAFIRLARGGELTCHAMGAFLVWVLLSRHGLGTDLSIPLYAAFGLLVIAAVLVVVALREPKVDAADPLSQRRFNPIGLPRVLILLAAFNFVFMLGLSISHCHMMILFFKDKFDLADGQVAIVSMVHRVSLGLPMLLAGFWATRPSRPVFIITLVLEGAFISLTILPPGAVGAVAVWFIHDPIGAAIWAPMNAWYMQHYARPRQRAADVATVMAMSTLGMAIGPVIAGYLAVYEGPLVGSVRAIDLPFFASGLVVAASAVFVFFLPKAPR